jgi:hypothetical protein
MATAVSLRAVAARPCSKPFIPRRVVLAQAAGGTAKTAGNPVAVKLKDAGVNTRQGTSR